MATTPGKELGKPKEVGRQEALQRYENVRKLLTRPDVQKGIGQMMSHYANKERFFQVVLNYVRQNDALLDCSQSSLLAGIVGIFKLGLDPTLKQVHLVPFWNTKKKMLEATLIIDFRGKISLMKRNGEVSTVSANVVYEKDTFEVQFGTDEFIRHIPSDEADPGNVKGAYVVLTMKDGTKKQDYMPINRIEQRMATSKTVDKKDGELVPREGTPWDTWYEEMCIKTVIHHISKQVSMSVEERLAEELDSRAEIGETQLDILPGTVEAILTGDSHEIPEEISPVVIFDQKVEKSIPHNEIGLWNDYLKITAEKNQKSIDEVKAQFSGEFDTIFSAFQRYKEKKERKEPIPDKLPPLYVGENDIPNQEDELKLMKERGMVGEKKK